MGCLDLDEMLKKEQTTLGISSNEETSALCLSGGGIRSATFSLGVIQALARNGWLDKFDYLSTVSGGGYIGSWLTSWIRRKGIANVVQALSSGAGTGQAEPAEVRRLRAYSNYLSPVTGVSADSLTMLSSFVRNLLINWIVLLPIIALLAALPLVHLAGVTSVFDDIHKNFWWTWGGVAAVAACAIIGVAYGVSDLPYRNEHQTRASYFTKWGFLPIVVGCLIASLWLLPFVKEDLEISYLAYMTIGGAVIHLLGVALGYCLLRPRRDVYGRPPVAKFTFHVWFVAGLLSLLAGGFGGAIVGLGVDMAAIASKNLGDSRLFAMAYATLAVPFLLMAYSVGAVGWIAILRRWTDEGAREWWARAGGSWILVAVAWIIIHVVAVWLPALVLSFWKYNAAMSAAGAGAGVLTALYGYFSKKSAFPSTGKVSGILEKVGIRVVDLAAALFMVSLVVGAALLLAKLLADKVDMQAIPDLSAWTKSAHDFGDMVAGHPFRWMLAAAGLMAFAYLTNRIIGVNTFSMHALYGNRLVRAYLGATRSPHDDVKPDPTQRTPHAFTGFDSRDDIAMADFGVAQPRPLFPVVNTAINFARAVAGRTEWQERKADAFVCTPYYSGSRVTGYCATEKFAGGRVPQQPIVTTQPPVTGLSLGRAFAISGAAVSPNMGYHTSQLIAFVMTFFNVRLGWWVPNPMLTDEKNLQRDEPRNSINALLSELFARTTADVESVYLSDGGHFENLGLYEMIRRGCRRVVVVDASCDPKYEFDDLERTVRRIRTDLGVEITFPKGLPTAASIKRTGQHYALGKIEYPNVNGKPVPSGVLIYIKPGLDGNEPIDVQQFAYRCNAGGKPFPHETTGDQFFSESQFESYRALGQYSVTKARFADWNHLKWDDFGVIEAGAPDHNGHASTQTKEDESDAAPAAGLAEAGTALANMRENISSKFTWDSAPAWLALLSSPFLVGALLPNDKPKEEGAASTQMFFFNASGGDRVDVISDPVSAVAPTIIFNGDRRMMLSLFEEARGCTNGSCTVGETVGNKDKDPAGAIVARLDDAIVSACGKGPVKFTLRGFSSSADFGKEALRNVAPVCGVTSEPNVILANRRAHNVAINLPKSMKLQGLDATTACRAVALWHGPAQLDNWRYQDQSGTAYSKGAGALNRRVDLEFQDLGACSSVQQIWDELKKRKPAVEGAIAQAVR